LAERIFDNISLLRDSEPTNSNEIVFIKGHSSNSDGGEGYFKWVPTLLKEDNNGTYIKVNTLVTGRWERAFNSGKDNPSLNDTIEIIDISTSDYTDRSIIINTNGNTINGVQDALINYNNFSLGFIFINEWLFLLYLNILENKVASIKRYFILFLY
jgi:hypothetical protein